MPKTIITAEEWETIESQAKAAEAILTQKRFKFFIDYLTQAQSEIERMIWNGTIREVREEMTISETLKKVFITPKKEQVQELIGQHKFIGQMLSFLNNAILSKKEAEELEEKHRLTIEKNYDK